MLIPDDPVAAFNVAVARGHVIQAKRELAALLAEAQGKPVPADPGSGAIMDARIVEIVEIIDSDLPSSETVIAVERLIELLDGMDLSEINGLIRPYFPEL